MLKPLPLLFGFCLQASADFLILQQAPKQVVKANYCIDSLLAEPKTGCMCWNRRETAGPVFDLTRNVLYVGGSDGYLHILSPQNGTLQKRIPLKGNLVSTPVLTAEHLVFGTNQAYLVSLDLKTLEPRWEQKLDSEILDTPVISGNWLYVVTGLSTLYALDLNSGEILWERRRSESGLVLGARSTPLLVADKLVIGSPSGKAEFIQAKTGDSLFDVVLGDLKNPEPNVVTTPILLDDNRVALASFNRGLYVLNLKTGEILVSMPNLSNLTQLAFAEGILVAAAPKAVYGIDIQNQKILWRFQYLKGSPSHLVSRDSRVYFSSDQNALYVLDLNTGKPLQILGSGLGFAHRFDFSTDHTLYALSTTGHLYRYGRKNTSSCCSFN